MVVHGLPELRLDAVSQRTRSGRLKMLLVLALCALPVVASYVTYFVIRPELRNSYGTLVEPTRAMPEGLSLVDLEGRRVAAPSLRGQWLFVVVAGGACDAACENALFLQRQLRETLGRDRQRLDKLWLIPDDAPVRPEVRMAVGAGTAPAMALRVPRADLERWLEPASGQALERHLYVVDPMGEWMMRFPPEPEPARVKRDIDRLLRASASWQRPLRTAP